MDDVTANGWQPQVCPYSKRPAAALMSGYRLYELSPSENDSFDAVDPLTLPSLRPLFKVRGSEAYSISEPVFAKRLGDKHYISGVD